MIRRYMIVEIHVEIGRIFSSVNECEHDDGFVRA
jgi:hypothetical protein